MTTKEAAARYLGEHEQRWGDRPAAVFNPNDRPVEELPIIFGWCNGGRTGWLNGYLVAQDGKQLGGHVCSDEAYMPHDLGILEGSRPDRHETFREHYPDGYRMEFVPYADAGDHPELGAAFALLDAQGGEG